MAEKYLVRINGDDVGLELRRDDDRMFVRREPEEQWKEASLERVGDSGLYLLMLDNHPLELYLERRRGGAIVTIGRHAFNCDVGRWRPPGQRVRTRPAPAGLLNIFAPMTGSIVEVRCATGDSVGAGQVLLVIESMKMNNELRSPAAGTVESVSAVPGQRVKANDPLVALRT